MSRFSAASTRARSLLRPGRSPVAAGLVGLAAALLAGSPASAASHLNCDAYAGAAVAQQQQNVALGCGFSGLRWSDDFAGHRAWCQLPATQMQNLTAEDSARRDGLAACAARAEAKINACRSYAERAVVASNGAAQRSCGFSGGRWSADYGGHFDWCLGAPDAARQQEDAARTNQLQGCFAAQDAAAARSLAAACETYAKTAVNQQNQNAGRGCGFSGGRWSADGVAHNAWCMSVGPQNAAGETRTREAALLNQCNVTVCRTRRVASATPPFFKNQRTCRTEPRPWR